MAAVPPKHSEELINPLYLIPSNPPKRYKTNFILQGHPRYQFPTSLLFLLLSIGTPSYAITISGAQSTQVSLGADEAVVVTGTGNYSLPGSNGRLFVDASNADNLGAFTNDGTITGQQDCAGGFSYGFTASRSMGQFTNTGTFTVNSAADAGGGINNQTSYRMFEAYTTSGRLSMPGFNNSGIIEWGTTNDLAEGIVLRNVDIGASGFINSGTIRGLTTSGTAILLESVDLDAGNFTNSGTIETTGSSFNSAGISINNSVGTPVINHSGTITNTSSIANAWGIRFLNSNNVTLNLTGDITTESTQPCVSFNSGSTTNTVNISGNPTFNSTIDSESVGNTVNITGAFTTDIANQFVDINSFNVSSGGSLTIDHNQSLSSLTNDGTIGVTAGATRTLVGNFVQNSGGVLQVNVDVGNNPSVLAVTGNVTIDPSSTVNINAPGGTDLAAVTLNNLITATGTFTGSSINVTSNIPNFNFTADLSGSTISITSVAAPTVGQFLNTIISNPTPSVSPGVSALANVLKSGIDNSQLNTDLQNVLNAIENETSDQAFELKKLLPSPITTGLAVPNSTFQTVLPNSAGIAQRGLLSTITGFSSQQLRYSPNFSAIQRIKLGSWGTIDAQYSNPTRMHTLPNLVNTRNFWLQSVATQISHRKRLNIDGYRSQIYNFTFGFDKSITEKFLLGFGSGFSSIASESKILSTNKSDSNVYKFFVYTNYSFMSVVNAFLQLDGNYAKTQAERPVAIGTSINRVATSTIHTNILGGEIGLQAIPTKKSDLEPRVSFEFHRFYQSDYHEEGASSLNLQIERRIIQQYAINMGLNLPLQLDEGKKWIFKTNFRQAIKDQSPFSTANFTGGGGQFVTYGLKESVFSSTLGLEFQYKPEKTFKLLNFMADLSIKDKAFGASCGLRLVF